MKITINSVVGREIIDSRGNPTVEATVGLTDGTFANAAVPSGASTGAYEAVELRDGGDRFNGKGVKKAVTNISKIISPEICGMSPFDQCAVDNKLSELDGSKNKKNLGANAILAVSVAVAKAAAKSLRLPLYRYLGGIYSVKLPVPMMNILNGGAHAANNIDIQEFMIMPVGAKCFKDALRMCAEVFHSLKSLLKSDGYSTAVGDEGGFAPSFSKDEEALSYIVEAIKKAGYKTETDFMIAVDAASSEWTTGEGGEYLLPKANKKMTRDELVSYWEDLCSQYPIISIEDGVAEDDWEGWSLLTERLGKKVQLVGDDLFVTNTERLEKGIEKNVANSILIKVNQIGTLTETLEAVQKANRAGYTAVISHRSGETEDTTIADIAAALNAGQIKTGAPSRTDRVAKYNRLLRIEEELDGECEYLGKDAFFCIK